MSILVSGAVILAVALITARAPAEVIGRRAAEPFPFRPPC